MTHADHVRAVVMKKLPNRRPKAVASDLDDVWECESRNAAVSSLDRFIKKYGKRFTNACNYLDEQRSMLFAPNIFPLPRGTPPFDGDSYEFLANVCVPFDITLNAATMSGYAVTPKGKQFADVHRRFLKLADDSGKALPPEFCDRLSACRPWYVTCGVSRWLALLLYLEQEFAYTISNGEIKHRESVSLMRPFETSVDAIRRCKLNTDNPQFPVFNDVPTWDKSEFQLRFRGVTIRSFTREAGNAFPILDTFEELGWPTRIDSPFPPGSSKRREGVRTLNSSLKTIRFESDGTGEGIRWAFC